MSPGISSNRSTELFHRITGNAFFAVLLIYSIVYAVERVTYVDSAWQFFLRVNNESFLFPSGRYGVFFSEIPLFLATKLHLPLKALVYVFSSSYILLYYLIWRLCFFTLKNPAAALTVVFCTFMGMREGFLHPVTETQQCVIFSALLYAVINADIRRNSIKAVLTTAVILLILFTHPIGIFTAGFVALYTMASQKNFKDVPSLIILAAIVIIGLWRFFMPADPYDAAQYAQLKSSSDDGSGSAALNFLLMHFPHFYWLAELAGLIALVWLASRREWLKFSALLLSVAAYVVIACITFRHGDSSIMLERVFLPAFFMINLVLADLLVNAKINKWMPAVVIVFLLLNGVRYINTGCLMYKKRVAYLDQLVQNGIGQGNSAYFLQAANADMDRILVPWALGAETLIYSNFKYGKNITVSLVEEQCPAGRFRVVSSTCMNVSELNARYFKLPSQPAVALKTAKK
jgi:hypothetical protein